MTKFFGREQDANSDDAVGQDKQGKNPGGKNMVDLYGRGGQRDGLVGQPAKAEAEKGDATASEGGFGDEEDDQAHELTSPFQRRNKDKPQGDGTEEET